MNRTGGKVHRLRLEIQGAERLFILGQILSENIPKCLGLLGTQEDPFVIADRDLVRCLAGSQSENKLEIPDTHPHLDAVGIRFTVVGSLSDVQLRLC